MSHPIVRQARSGRIAKLFGVDIRLHWTFMLLLAWVFAMQLFLGHGLPAAVRGVGLIAAIFGCVLLHELGHVLVARRFGISTRDITLYPIGGVSSLEHIPERPRAEISISIVGPFVNFALALVIWLVAGRPALDGFGVDTETFASELVYINLSLGVFNLLPAFPMDGGRVLRALLALRMDHVRATQVAAGAGQLLAALLGIAGFALGNFMLMLVALFVFLAAQQEAAGAELRTALRGVSVSEVMLREYHVLDAASTASEAMAVLLASDQDEYPVVHDAQLIGVVTRDVLLRALNEGHGTWPLRLLAAESWEVVDGSAPLEAAFRLMQDGGHGSMPVVAAGELVGVLTLEHIRKWITVQSALHRSGRDKGHATAPA